MQHSKHKRIIVNNLRSRQTARNGEVYTDSFAYNSRSELTGAVSSADPAYNYAYAFDNIGNRATASAAGTQTNYATNALNQYASVDDFAPAYDADGNVISLKTATGTWQITYNGANRPVTWVKSTGEKIFMMYDSLGRRFEKRVLNAAGRRILRERYVYAGYNCVQILNGDGGNAVEKEFVWDPTEPTGTRPLTWTFVKWGLNLFYAHDGNKNVSDVFFLALQNGVAAHYEYAPFGGITYTSKNTPYTIDLIAANPFRFSSEFYDPELDLIYYNYRHYSPSLGRWLSRDPIEEKGGLNLYAFCKNNGINYFDMRGGSVIAISGWSIGSAIGIGISLGGLFAGLGIALAVGIVVVGAVAIIERISTTNDDADSQPIAASLDECPPCETRRNCDDETYNRLKKTVDNAKNESSKLGRCKNSDSCEQLKNKIFAWQNEIVARENMMKQCFNGGDEAHKNHLKNVCRSEENCLSIFTTKCGR